MTIALSGKDLEIQVHDGVYTISKTSAVQVSAAETIAQPASGLPLTSIVIDSNGGFSTKLGKQIVVLDRGYIYIGDVRYTEQFLIIENTKCIRRWGTTEGLGELREGPTASTVLDEAGTVIAPLRSVISLTEVDSTKWS